MENVISTKRLLFSLLGLIALLSAPQGANAQTINDDVVFEEKIHDFGTINEADGKVTHRFRFTNRGNKPVVLLRARSGCSCVQAQVATEPIAPGASGTVTVSFDPEYRPGHFSKEIVVVDADRRINRVWVKGDVVAAKHLVTESHRYDLGRGLCADRKTIHFGHVKAGTVSRQTLSIGNDSDRTLNIDFISDDPAQVMVSAGARLDPGCSGKIEIGVAAALISQGEHTVRLTPVVNGEKASPVTITFTVGTR